MNRLPTFLHSPFLRGFFYFLLTIPLVFVAAEGVARSPLGDLLPAPSVQADSFLFDAKIRQLENQTRRDGRLDCLILGSSVANSDFDPAVIEQTYRQQTGESIHCYNLGLPAMTIENATALAEAVIARFHPKVILYPVLSRDIHHLVANADFLEESDWLQYYRGRSSLNGWLLVHAQAWRYFQTWRYWLILPNRVKMREETVFLTPKGFQPAQGIRNPYGENVTMTPNRLQRVWEDAGRVEALRVFLSLRKKGVQIVVVEGPAYRDAYPPRWEAYETHYIAPLRRLLEEEHIPFWRTDAISAQIPQPHWYDWLHLNAEGAAVFSQWLGETLAENAWLFK